MDGHRSLSLAPLPISAPFLRVYQGPETHLGLFFCLQHGKDAIFAQNVEKNRNETGLESGWWIVSGNPPPDVLELKRYALSPLRGYVSSNERMGNDKKLRKVEDGKYQVLTRLRFGGRVLIQLARVLSARILYRSTIPPLPEVNSRLSIIGFFTHAGATHNEANSMAYGRRSRLIHTYSTFHVISAACELPNPRPLTRTACFSTSCI